MEVWKDIVSISQHTFLHSVEMSITASTALPIRDIIHMALASIEHQIVRASESVARSP